MRYAPLLFLVLVLRPAAAQAPDAQALLQAWQSAWAAAEAGLAEVVLDEEMAYRMQGPRGPIELRTRGVVRLVPGTRPQRTLAGGDLNGTPLSAEDIATLEERFDRTGGPHAAHARRPPPLPGVLLARARAAGTPEPDRIGQRDAWRVALVFPGGEGHAERRALAWFAQTAPGETPRLLRTRFEVRVPDEGEVVFVTLFRPVEGIDLPSATRREMTLQQRRRLRHFTISMETEGRYRVTQIARR